MGGYTVYDFIWVYKSMLTFILIDDGDKLYKIKTDGTGKTKLSDDVPKCIQNDEDWIYYSIRGNEWSHHDGIIKMKKDSFLTLHVMYTPWNLRNFLKRCMKPD